MIEFNWLVEYWLVEYWLIMDDNNLTKKEKFGKIKIYKRGKIMSEEKYKFSFEIFCDKEDSNILTKVVKKALSTETSWRFRSLRNLKKRIV